MGKSTISMGIDGLFSIAFCMFTSGSFLGGWAFLWRQEKVLVVLCGRSAGTLGIDLVRGPEQCGMSLMVPGTVSR